MTGGAAARPLPGLAALSSGFDALGETWTPIGGTDPFADRRTALRKQLAEYLGLGEAPGGSNAADIIYREADWMLPQALP